MFFQLFFTILVMKRQITAQNSDFNTTPIIDWSSCSTYETGDELCSMDDGTKGLAKQCVAYWKNYLLPFESLKITMEFVIRKDGIIHQGFVTVIKSDNGKYHHNCKTIFWIINCKLS